MVGAGLGIGLVPAMTRRADTPVVLLHVDAPDCHRTLTLVWRRDTYHSIAARRLRDFAREHCRTSQHAPSSR